MGSDINVNQFNYNHGVQPVTNPVGTSGTVNVNDQYNRSFQLPQAFKTGTTGTFGFTSTKSTTNNTNLNFIPNLGGSLLLNVQQSLLRGFGAVNYNPIKIAKNNIRAADYGFRHADQYAGEHGCAELLEFSERFAERICGAPDAGAFAAPDGAE